VAVEEEQPEEEEEEAEEEGGQFLIGVFAKLATEEAFPPQDLVTLLDLLSGDDDLVYSAVAMFKRNGDWEELKGNLASVLKFRGQGEEAQAQEDQAQPQEEEAAPAAEAEAPLDGESPLVLKHQILEMRMRVLTHRKSLEEKRIAHEKIKETKLQLAELSGEPYEPEYAPDGELMEDMLARTSEQLNGLDEMLQQQLAQLDNLKSPDQMYDDLNERASEMAAQNAQNMAEAQADVQRAVDEGAQETEVGEEDVDKTEAELNEEAVMEDDIESLKRLVTTLSMDDSFTAEQATRTQEMLKNMDANFLAAFFLYQEHQSYPQFKAQLFGILDSSEEGAGPSKPLDPLRFAAQEFAQGVVQLLISGDKLTEEEGASLLDRFEADDPTVVTAFEQIRQTNDPTHIIDLILLAQGGSEAAQGGSGATGNDEPSDGMDAHAPLFEKLLAKLHGAEIISMTGVRKASQLFANRHPVLVGAFEAYDKGGSLEQLATTIARQVLEVA